MMRKFFFIATLILPLLLPAAENPQPALQDIDNALRRELLWKNNSIGKPARVLPAFDPIQCQWKGSKLDIKVKKRLYQYENSLFPTQITAAGKKLLAAPIQLKVDEQNVFSNADIQLIRNDDTMAEFLTTAGNGRLRASAYCSMEFDGFLWIRLTVAPETAPVEVNSLYLDIELPDEQALYLERHGVYEAKGDPICPMPRQSTSWGFSCSIWLGDEDAGLCFCAESDENWDAKGGHRDQIELQMLPDRKILRMKFVKSARQLDKALILQFGLLATPSKDMPENWRTVSHFWSPQISWSWSRCFGGGWDTNMYESYLNGRYKTDGVDGTYLYSSGRYFSATPVPSCNDTSLFPEYILYDRRISEVSREKYPAFMMNKPLRMSINAGEYLCGSISSELGEMYLYNMREAARKYKLHFVYIDALGARPNMNPLHNAGYIDELGERQPTVAIRAARDIVRRLHDMLDQESGGHFALQIHGWDAMAPVLPFFTSRLDGEGYISEIGAKGHYSEVVPMEMWRGGHRARAHGVVGVFLPELSYGSNRYMRAYYEEMVMFLLLHDIVSDRKQTITGVRDISYNAMTRYGMQNLVFHPFWKGEQPVTSSDQEVKVSSYTDPDNPERGIIVVGNTGKNHKMAAINLQLPAWKNLKRLQDISHNCTIEVQNGQARFPISALNFRLFAPDFQD